MGVGQDVGSVVPAKVCAKKSRELDVVCNDVDACGFEPRFAHLVAEKPGIASDVEVGRVGDRQALAGADILDDLVTPLRILADRLPAAALRQLDWLVGSLFSGIRLVAAKTVDDLGFRFRPQALEALVADRLGPVVVEMAEETGSFAFLTNLAR